MSSLSLFKHLVGAERSAFVRVVAAVPEDGLDYRPDPKSRTAREMIGHLLGHTLDLVELVDEGAIHHRNQLPVESVAQAAREFDASFGLLADKLGGVDQAKWDKAATFFVGEHEVAKGSHEQLAWMMLLDAVHHRGQLSAYLRPMGGKVPSIYGPSADEQGPAH
ncbi:MAG: DinB family protein [Gemmatimonadales bacterium]